MSPPRLAGNALRNARRLSELAGGLRVVRDAVLRDYGVDRMLALPAESRRALDTEARAVRGAAPRQWADAGLAAPARRGHRRASHELVAAYARGQTTPTAVLERLVARLATGEFGAATHSPMIVTDYDNARSAAAASARRYRDGRPLGPLDGVPIVLKDQHDMRGLPTSGGTAYRTRVALDDAFMVTTLRRAGAVIYGKTLLTEWGMTPTGQNPNFRMPRNVYRNDRAAGGSSTGSAVATALGFCTVASGTDGGGSIRIPAALNGVFGLKPTFSRISRTGDAFGGSVGHTGPIGQSTTDLVDFLGIAAMDVDAADPLSTYATDVPAVADTWRAALGRGVTGCKIGVPSREWRDATGAIAAAGDVALRALEAAGAKLVEIDVPLADQALAVGVTTIGPEALAGVSDDIPLYGERMSEDLRATFNLLKTMTALEFLSAQRVRAAMRRALAAVLAGVDVIALPATASLAPTYPLAEDLVAVSDTAALQGLCRHAFLANLTGLPAGTAPVGQSEDLPIGLQIVGDAWDEASVVAVLAQLERLGVTELPAPPSYFDVLG